MKETDFQSCLAKKMKCFVALRRLSGTDYKGQTKILGYFDKFLVKENFKKPYLTKYIVERYLSTVSHLTQRYRSNQCSLIRQFGIYLSRFEPCCYIPESIPSGKTQDEWRAYIFTKNQIRDLLAATHRLRPTYWLRPYVFHTLIGLLYTTGIRISEALALNIKDFYPDTLRLHIREGKFRKERWVPLSVSTCEVMKKYINMRQQVVARGSDQSLFIGFSRTRLCRSSAHSVFFILLEQCGIKRTTKNGPRIHDIRHTFACHRLLEWYHDGRDINARLPVLATYMGHLKISSTQIYIQATPELRDLANHKFLNYVHKNKIIKGGKS
jgi:site-specific recombinase XerD